MILTQENTKNLFSRFKALANKSFNRGDYNGSVKYLGLACKTAYTFYIGHTDAEIENLIEKISNQINKTDTYQPQVNKVVMYDSFSQDAQGLTMQYLDAIIAAGWDLLYITSFNLDDKRSQRIKQTLRDYPKASVIQVPRNTNYMEQVQCLYDKVIEYAPSKLFMHFFPDAVSAAVLFYALPKEITKYQINLTDHTYWVGAGCVDYSFEFREYGASLSAGRRGINRDHLFLLPFYPMMKKTEFNGFPQETEGRVKIFSGSSIYKIIDENDTFFKLNKAILDANPKAVTLFAGGGDTALLNELISKYGLEGRFIPIGQRNDIFECYKHSDIYLSTYPLFGALMAQFAAHAGLPILAYANSKSGVVEEVVCQKKKERITFTNMDALVVEATRLITDEEYRHLRGEVMKGCVIDENEFNRSFKLIVETGVNQYDTDINEDVELHYMSIDDKLKLENSTKGYQAAVLRSLGVWNTLKISPGMVMDGFVSRIKTSSFGKYIK